MYSELTKHLAESNYAFVCPSPETQARVVRKKESDCSTQRAQSAEDIFGWNLAATKYSPPYRHSTIQANKPIRKVLQKILPTNVLEHLLKESVLLPEADNDTYRSTIRISNFYVPQIPYDNTGTATLYYIHSSFPSSSDSVFFGPDTYLFTTFLSSATQHLQNDPTSIVDICCGSGAGAIHMARSYPRSKVLGLDLNPRALVLGSVNTKLAGIEVDFYESNLYSNIPESLSSEGIDLIVSNPPYIASSKDGHDIPIYADGGAGFGLDISLRIVEEGMKILSPSGVIMLYTGVAIPSGRPGYDPFLDKLKQVEEAEIVEYSILHPDMWSEEIGKGAYADVGRIQVIGAVLGRKGR